MPIVVRPLDRALTAARVALVPVAVLVLSVPTYRALTSVHPPAQGTWVMTLVALSIAVLCVGLLQTEPVGRRVDRALARVRRRIAMACNHAYGAVHHDSRIACRLTPEVLRAPLFRYEEQNRAVSALTEACSAGERGTYWFVEGESGSGKSRMALLLVHALVRDLDLCELGSRCLLYDFGHSDAIQEHLCRRLGTSRHDGAVILVDNFQLVRPEPLRALTSHLVEHRGRNTERLVVFFTRPGESWNLSPGADVRLLSEAKALRRHVVLSGPPSASVIDSVVAFDADACKLIGELQSGSIASAAQLHLAQVIARHRAVPEEVLGLLNLLRETPQGTPTPDLVRVLAVVTALAMHRGGFTRRELRRAVRVMSDGLPLASRAARTIRLATTFRRMHRVGIVTRIEVGGTRYLFHEAIAEQCIDRLATVPEFAAPFSAVGRARLQEHLSRRDDLGAWLTAAEIGETDIVELSFDAALGQGAYSRMTRCLRRATDRYPLPAALQLQRAILLDRTGEFVESRAQYSETLLEQVGATSELGVMFAASRAEASHDDAAKAGLEVIRKHPERLPAVVAEYWTLHFAAHHGTFNPDGLLALATEALELLNGRDRRWLEYQLARMHFDSLRHHYLCGGEPTAIDSAERRALGDYLRDRLPTYEALCVLYRRAHLVGHVLLPRVALFDRTATPAEAALADVASEDVTNTDALILTAQRLYRRARDEFWQYGDREAKYLEADVLNAEMIEHDDNLDSFRVPLAQYEEFIESTGFDDIASYPHLYYLRWHMLKYYAILASDTTRDARTADEHLAEAERRLRSIVRLDAAVRNEYGLLRANVLGALLRSVQQPADQRELDSLRLRAIGSGYGFEARLLGRLVERPTLTPVELRAIFRFYPFVHQ